MSKVGALKAKLIVLGVTLVGLAASIAAAVWMPPRELQPHEGLIYLGPDTRTVMAGWADEAAVARAEAAFRGAAYFAAYAEGPDGRSGIWTGAHRADRARQYALADCGEGCLIVAERHPAATSDFTVRAIPPAMATGLKTRIWRGDIYARGGANAWGAAADVGRGPPVSARRRALEECNARLAEENTPTGVTAEPCKVRSFLGVHDERPTPELYPAPFEMALMDLVAAEPELVRREVRRGRKLGSFFEAPNPKGLHGASAFSPDGARGHARSAGWAQAGEQMALLMCEADRRFGDAPCVVSKSMVPSRPVPQGVLAVAPDLMEAFRDWEATAGAGAFAISPFGGAWAYTSDHDDLETAIQKAADWCLYYGRRSRTEFDFDYHFIEVDIPCRIVAVRDAESATQR